MSYSCNKCGKFLFAPGRCSRCAAPETLVRTKSELEVITAERDRLAAENAELRKTVAETEQACSELSDDLSQMHQLKLEAKCHGDLEESHKIMVDVVAERDAELAAANATLDALREAVPVNACDVVSYDASDYFHYLFDAIWILYPQPPETTDEPR